MAKRFTSSEKWSDSWYRKLPPKIKCLWDWLYTQCDIAGTIAPDWELASFQIGEKCDKNDLKFFEKQISELPNGRLFLKDFIRFQYGELTAKCPAHRPVIAILDRHSIPIQYPINREQEKEKEKDVFKSKAKSVANLSDFYEVYEMKYGELHSRQKDAIELDLMRIPEELRQQAIDAAIKYGQKTIHDPRKFQQPEKVQAIQTEPKPQVMREFGGINESY